MDEYWLDEPQEVGYMSPCDLCDNMDCKNCQLWGDK